MPLPRWTRFLLGGATPPTVPAKGPLVFDVPTLRLQGYVRRTFADPEPVLVTLRTLPHAVYGGQDAERVQAALVLQAQGSPDRLGEAVVLLQRDWRDVLVAGGLADADWPKRLDAALGSRGHG